MNTDTKKWTCELRRGHGAKEQVRYVTVTAKDKDQARKYVDPYCTGLWWCAFILEDKS